MSTPPDQAVVGILGRHARHELALADTDTALAAAVCAAVDAFELHHLSQDDIEDAAELMFMLVRREPITELTADPHEWADRTPPGGQPVWQSQRWPAAWSCDQGRTYTLVHDTDNTLHRSAAPPRWVRALQETYGMSPVAAQFSVMEYLSRGPIDAADRMMMDDAPDDDRTRYLHNRWGRGWACAAWQHTTMV